MQDKMKDGGARRSNDESTLDPNRVTFTGNDMDGVVGASDSGPGRIPGVLASVDGDDTSQQDASDGSRGAITEAPEAGATPFGPGTRGFGAGSGGAGGATIDAGSGTVT